MNMIKGKFIYLAQSRWVCTSSIPLWFCCNNCYNDKERNEIELQKHVLISEVVFPHVGAIGIFIFSEIYAMSLFL
jgi:hypothetical protein